jgi:pimeloyl-ACP methyl ester carboxylesterase
MCGSLAALSAAVAPETGRLAGLPFVRVGPTGEQTRPATGRAPLVLVPGLNDPLHSVATSGWVRRAVAGYCVTFAADRAVYYLSQPREGRSAGVAGIATAYESALDAVRRRHDRVPALLGLSMGGFLASEVVAARPDLVDRLVLGLAADRVDRASGRDTLRRWDDHAVAGRWPRVYREAGALLADGGRRVGLQVAGTVYGRLRPPAESEPFRRAIAACLDYDGARTLRAVAETAVPTLVVGGDADPFFTDDAFDRAARLADCRRVRLRDAAHDAVLSGAAFDRVVGAFLAVGG